MFERPASGERAVLVQLDLGQGAIDERLSELKLLVLSAGASVEAVVQGKRAAPDPKLFAGSGKVQEIGEALRVHGADIVIFNHALSPGQQRNLERVLQCMVIDRTALILDIFAQRARSHEGCDAARNRSLRTADQGRARGRRGHPDPEAQPH